MKNGWKRNRNKQEAKNKKINYEIVKQKKQRNEYVAWNGGTTVKQRKKT